MRAQTPPGGMRCRLRSVCPGCLCTNGGFQLLFSQQVHVCVTCHCTLSWQVWPSFKRTWMSGLARGADSLEWPRPVCTGVGRAKQGPACSAPGCDWRLCRAQASWRGWTRSCRGAWTRRCRWAAPRWSCQSRPSGRLRSPPGAACRPWAPLCRLPWLPGSLEHAHCGAPHHADLSLSSLLVAPRERLHQGARCVIRRCSGSRVLLALALSTPACSLLDAGAPRWPMPAARWHMFILSAASCWASEKHRAC